MAKAGFEVGPSYDEFELTLQARQAMMRNATDKVCELCFLDSQDMVRLSKRGSSKERLSKLASGLVVDSLLDCTGRLQMQDAAKDPSKCAAKETLLLLRSSVLRYSEKSGFAVPEEIVKDVGRAVVVDPANADYNTLASILEELETARGTAQDILGSLVVKKFFCESTVGLKIVGHAETVLEGRQAEKTKEGLLLSNEMAAQKLVESSFCLGEHEYKMDAFRTKDLQDLEESSGELLKVLKESRKRGSRCLATERIQRYMGNVWSAAYESFRKMLGEFFTALCKEGDSALGNAGTLRKEGENAFIIDLGKYKDEWDQVKRQALEESPLLESSPFAKKLDIKKNAELLLEGCIAVSTGLSIALCLSCPKVAALYEAYCNVPDAMLNKYSLLSPETLPKLGTDTALPNKVIAEVVAQIKAEVETRQTRCESDLMSRIDSFLEGTGVSISASQSQELVGRTPRGSKECIDYVGGFLTMASGLVAFSAKIKEKSTAEISETCDDIKVVQKSLEAYKSSWSRRS